MHGEQLSDVMAVPAPEPGGTPAAAGPVSVKPGPSNYPVVCTSECISRPETRFHLDYLTLMVSGGLGEIGRRVSTPWATAKGWIEREWFGRSDGWVYVDGEAGRARIIRSDPEGTSPGISMRYMSDRKGAERVQVNLGGEAWKWLQRWDVAALPEFLESEELTVRCSRLDAAWDGPAFTVADVRRCLADGGVVSKAKSRKCLDSADYGDRDGVRDGSTVYIGRRGSDRYLCVYDYRGPVRVELRCGRRWAQRLYESTVWDHFECPGNYVAERSCMATLTGFVRFCVPTSDSNNRRWPDCEWWSQFVGDVAPMRLPSARPREVTMKDVKASIERRCGAALSVVVEYYLSRDDERGLLDWLKVTAERSRVRQSKRLRAALSNSDDGAMSGGLCDVSE